MAEMAERLFIIYYQTDSIWAEWIAWQLEEKGYEAIVKAWDFRPGESIVLRQQEALATAQRTLLLLSEEALKMPEIQAQWSVLFQRDPTGAEGKLLPIKIRACQPDGFLRGRISIDLSNLAEAEARESLLAGIDINRNKPKQAPSYPGVAYPHVQVTEPAFPKAEQRELPDEAIGTCVLFYNKHAGLISTVAWNPRGERIATGGTDREIHIWDVRTGEKCLAYHGHSGPITQVWEISWSPDGKYIASGGTGAKVHVWSTETAADIHSHGSYLNVAMLVDTFTVAWSPIENRVASSCGGKYANQSVEVWDALSGGNSINYNKNMPGVGVPATISALAWSPDGRYIASAGSDKRTKTTVMPIAGSYKMTTQVWEVATQKTICTHKAGSAWIYGLSWSPDGSEIASVEDDKSVRIWNAKNGEERLTYRGHSQAVRAVAWSPNGRQLASCSNDRSVQLWSSQTGKVHYIYRGHTDNINCLAWSPDGRYLASGGNDKTVQIWRAG